MRVLRALALGFLALAFLGTWAYGGYSDTECTLEIPRGIPESAAVHEEAGLWPPGARCVFELPSGNERVEPGPVPWAEWTLLAVCAGAVLLVARLWARFVESPPPESNRQPLHYK